MSAGPACLIDSNILLRLAKRDHAEYLLVRAAVTALQDRGTPLYYAMQNIAEFWNASTRPQEQNGFGISIEETDENVRAFETAFNLLPDDEDVYREWRRLVTRHSVRGVKVHDARLVALLHTHGMSRILSFNEADFRRYPEITVLHPQQVLAAS